METKTHWKKVFNSDYLGVCDLDDGKDLKAIIKRVIVKKVKDPQGKEQERNVAEFTDSKIKPMILNVTNCKLVKKFAGSTYINDWNNVSILIYAKGDIKAFGELTEGLRIRPTQPVINKTKTPLTAEKYDSAVNFLKQGKTIDDLKAHYSFDKETETKLIKDSTNG